MARRNEHSFKTKTPRVILTAYTSEKHNGNMFGRVTSPHMYVQT